jgi:hypothetical protein
MKNVIAVLALLLLAAPAAAQSKDQQQILALEQAMGKAIEAGDAVSYDKMTTNDFQFISGNGAVISKADRLALLKKGGAPGFRTSDHAIRIYGDVAVVTGRQGPGEGPVRFTRVWVRQGSEWRAVATQATVIQQPKP